MNIEKWTVDKIMQLPDHVFGERYLISCELAVSGDNIAWSISEYSFPNKAVLWSVNVMWAYSSVTTAFVRMGMAMKIPTSAAQMDQSLPILPECGRVGTKPRKLYGFQYNGMEAYFIRKLIQPQGRKLVIESNAWTDKAIVIRVGAVVSAIPKEVPDWMC